MWKKDMRHEFVAIWQCHNGFWNELTMGHKEANKYCQWQQFQHDLLGHFSPPPPPPNLVHKEMKELEVNAPELDHPTKIKSDRCLGITVRMFTSLRHKRESVFVG